MYRFAIPNSRTLSYSKNIGSLLRNALQLEEEADRKACEDIIRLKNAGREVIEFELKRMNALCDQFDDENVLEVLDEDGNEVDFDDDIDYRFWCEIKSYTIKWFRARAEGGLPDASDDDVKRYLTKARNIFY